MIHPLRRELTQHRPADWNTRQEYRSRQGWAAEGKDVLSPVPVGRWGIAAEKVLAASRSDVSCVDRTWTDRGGYVQGFEQRFDPSGFAIAEEEVVTLDPLFQWVLHCAREALRDAGARGDWHPGRRHLRQPVLSFRIDGALCRVRLDVRTVRPAG